MVPSPRKTNTSTAAVPTVVFAFIYTLSSFFRGDILVTQTLTLGQITRARQGLKTETYDREAYRLVIIVSER